MKSQINTQPQHSHPIKFSLSTCLIVISLALCGCSKPVWQTGFDAFLKKKTLSDDLPFDVTGLKIEPVTATPTEANFRFAVDFKLRENLYEPVKNEEWGIDFSALAQAKEAFSRIPESQRPKLEVPSGSTATILKQTATAGQAVKFRGTATATKNGEAWTYQLTKMEAASGQEMPGNPAPGKKWLLAGSTEAKSAVEEAKAEAETFVVKVDTALKEVELERKRKAAEQAAREQIIAAEQAARKQKAAADLAAEQGARAQKAAADLALKKDHLFELFKPGSKFTGHVKSESYPIEVELIVDESSNPSGQPLKFRIINPQNRQVYRDFVGVVDPDGLVNSEIAVAKAAGQPPIDEFRGERALSGSNHQLYAKTRSPSVRFFLTETGLRGEFNTSDPFAIEIVKQP